MGRKEYTPKELYDILKKTVIGQDEYLKKLAVTMWLHHERIKLWDDRDLYPDLHLQKSNLLCVGPTGSGKTLAVTTLAKIYGMKVIVADMSNFTGTSWKGRNAEELIEMLYIECNHNKQETERGIIVMDEIDKALLQGRDERYPASSVEHTLLKMVEGTVVNVEVGGREAEIDTTNILFIAAGAFEGIETFIEKRMKKKNAIGFGQAHYESLPKDVNYLDYLERRDLIAYGAGAQLLGRFAELAVLHKLSVEDLTEILLHSEASVVRSLDDTMKYSCGIRVFMDEAGARAVAQMAIQEGTGARGLAQIIQPVVNEMIFLIESVPEEGSTVNELLLTEKNGEPWVMLREGKRFRAKDAKETRKLEKRPYSLPKPKKNNVEQFSWHVLSYYLNKVPQTYETAKALHNLLCSILFFLHDDCNKDDWQFSNVQKLADKDIYDGVVGRVRFNASTAKSYYLAFRSYSGKDAHLKLKDAIQEFDTRAYVTEAR